MLATWINLNGSTLWEEASDPITSLLSVFDLVGFHDLVRFKFEQFAIDHAQLFDLLADMNHKRMCGFWTALEAVRVLFDECQDGLEFVKGFVVKLPVRADPTAVILFLSHSVP